MSKQNNSLPPWSKSSRVVTKRFPDVKVKNTEDGKFTGTANGAIKVKKKGSDNADTVKKKDAELDKLEMDHREKEKPEADSDLDSPLSPVNSVPSLNLPEMDYRAEDTCDDVAEYDKFPILRYIQDNVIGNNIVINGPFGPKKVVYCDFTASGRSLSFIEDYIRSFVSPFYANTHSETGRNARQTSKFREEARAIIKKCVNAGKDDVVIFTGSGATSAIHKVAWGLKVNQPRVAEETVVFVGPYEHHSNILLWKEFGAATVRIKDTPDGTIDIEHLASELKFWKEKKRQMLVSVSAASNVTGIVTDVDHVSLIAHQHGALVVFDYAGGGPYLKIDMNSSKQSYIDAVFISPHKFIGGPGSPGLVVAKKWMFKNNMPDRVGGGTVVYVSRDAHHYSNDIEAREEGGTPAIIESIRTGLAFQLKNSVSEQLIHDRDEYLCCKAFSTWEKNPNLLVLGSHVVERVSIFSFIVIHEETGKTLHYNFISTLLNDLFGIQSRGGCACAGPYGHDLLGITEPMAKRLKWFTNDKPGMDTTCLQNPLSIMRPGFVRVNLPYFYDKENVDYIIQAVDMVATHGWKLLPQYTFNPYSGNFTYKGDSTEDEEDAMFSLHDIEYGDNGNFRVNRNPPNVSTNITLDSMLQQAENVFKEASDSVKNRHSSASKRLRDLIPKDRHKLRWFMTPQEANDVITGSGRLRRFRPVMNPRIYKRDGNTGSLPETFRSRYSDTFDENAANKMAQRGRKNGGDKSWRTPRAMSRDRIQFKALSYREPMDYEREDRDLISNDFDKDAFNEKDTRRGTKGRLVLPKI